jgi:hypothetical protein
VQVAQLLEHLQTEPGPRDAGKRVSHA